jgi:uncharacterized repeat protein (TIGR03837 family)
MNAAASPEPSFMWDIFCRVIDNFGDIGVSWRLASNLAQRGQRVRLWVDDGSALQWMVPNAKSSQHAGIEIRNWTDAQHAQTLQTLAPADVWVEMFGCEIAPEFIAAYAYSKRLKPTNGIKFPVWINLEYLTAEDYAERSHGLASPVMSGPAKGFDKTFFYPGFKPRTGGLLREPDLAVRQAQFDKAAWLAQQGIPWQGERLVSLFCYEPAALPQLMAQLQNATLPYRLLVTQGRAAMAVQSIQTLTPQLDVHYLPLLSHADYDHLLWASDFNCVRGEDSLVRALWAGKPFAWQIYPQDDGAHHPKLEAFLALTDLHPTLKQFYRVWNNAPSGNALTGLPALELDAWQVRVDDNHQRLLEQQDLVSQLMGFVLKKR